MCSGKAPVVIGTGATDDGACDRGTSRCHLTHSGSAGWLLPSPNSGCRIQYLGLIVKLGLPNVASLTYVASCSLCRSQLSEASFVHGIPCHVLLPWNMTVATRGTFGTSATMSAVGSTHVLYRCNEALNGKWYSHGSFWMLLYGMALLHTNPAEVPPQSSLTAHSQLPPLVRRQVQHMFIAGTRFGIIHPVPGRKC